MTEFLQDNPAYVAGALCLAYLGLIAFLTRNS